MSDGRFLYWLAVSESEPVKFRELAHEMAKAMHPDDPFAYGGARLNIEAQLPEAVTRKELIVRNPLDMSSLTLPMGEALQDSVLLPHDLRSFLESRGIELRLIPHGSGPRYWTLENAARAIAVQENWHDGARETLLHAMLEAAANRSLVVRDPHTDLPLTSGNVRPFYEQVTPADVNTWLSNQKASYRWHVVQEAPTAEDQTRTLAGDGKSAGAGVRKQESQEQRQARRYRQCVAAGLPMPSNDYAALPRGIGALAKAEGITRQAFSEDVKAHINRLQKK
jgi:hypothetical protein